MLKETACNRENTLNYARRWAMAPHTYDAYMRPLDSYIYKKVRFLHIKGIWKWVNKSPVPIPFIFPLYPRQYLTSVIKLVHMLAIKILPLFERK